VRFKLDMEGENGDRLINLLTEDHSRADKKGEHCLLLDAYAYRWFRIGGLDYLLKRSDIDE
jgi:maltose alpha-D-glucosyltransferase/alpha-amylase